MFCSVKISVIGHLKLDIFVTVKLISTRSLQINSVLTVVFIITHVQDAHRVSVLIARTNICSHLMMDKRVNKLSLTVKLILVCSQSVLQKMQEVSSICVTAVTKDISGILRKYQHLLVNVNNVMLL